jgi:signal transduction histidine kinase
VSRRTAFTRWGVPFGILAFSIVAVAAELSTAGRPAPPVAGAYLAAVLTSAALFARGRRSLAVTGFVLAVCLAYHLVGYPGQGPAFALFVVVFSIPAIAPLAWSLPVAVAIGPIWAIIPTLPPHAASVLDWAVVSPALAMVAIAVTGAVLSVTARQAATERAAQAAEARAHIARDIHDVLAHTIAAITVQANLALDALDDDPELARSAVRRIRDLARAAAPQLRHSLLQLRADGHPAPPQPTLELVGRVLDEARAAGFQVDEHVDVAPGSLGAVIELAVARIVQEAVTNAVRHSGGTALRCAIAVDDGCLTAELSDNGQRMPGPDGLGVAGMRERSASVGGSVETGPTPDGYRVRARIPISGPGVGG